MYLDFFGLNEKPFSLTPDPRFLYLSESHRQALDHLIYGVQEHEGFILIVGDIGTGKTRRMKPPSKAARCSKAWTPRHRVRSS